MPFGLPPSKIDVDQCVPQLFDGARKNAEFINTIIQKGDGPEFQELKTNFEAVMAEAKQAGLCPFAPGPDDVIQRSNALVSRAQDIDPLISPTEEQAILEQTLPIPEPEPSFLRRNAIPLFVGGGVLILGILGMVLLIRA